MWVLSSCRGRLSLPLHTGVRVPWRAALGPPVPQKMPRKRGPWGELPGAAAAEFEVGAGIRCTAVADLCHLLPKSEKNLIPSRLQFIPRA